MLVISLGLLFPNNLALIVIYIMAIHCRIPRMKRQNRTLLFHLRTLPNISNIPCLQIFQNKKEVVRFAYGLNGGATTTTNTMSAYGIGIAACNLSGSDAFSCRCCCRCYIPCCCCWSFLAIIIISKWLPFSPISVNPKKMEKNSSLLALPLSLFLCRCCRRIGCHLLNPWCIFPVINWPGSTTNTSQCLNSDKIDTNECNSSSR